MHSGGMETPSGKRRPFGEGKIRLHYTTYLPIDMVQTMKRVAIEQGWSQQELVEVAVRRYLRYLAKHGIEPSTKPIPRDAGPLL